MALQPFTTHTGIAAALMRENIDTDVIIPSREITSPGRDGYGPKAFAPWRYVGGRSDGPEDPSFVLNREPWRRASILIAGANFGCGSSREMAVWALAQFGFRVVIALSFGAIFRVNCVRNGVLPVVLGAADVVRLASPAERGAVLAVDLQALTITADGGQPPVRFALDEDDRQVLMTGMDAIDRTLSLAPSIAAFEAQDRTRRPWVWAAARA